MERSSLGVELPPAPAAAASRAWKSRRNWRSIFSAVPQESKVLPGQLTVCSGHQPEPREVEVCERLVVRITPTHQRKPGLQLLASLGQASSRTQGVTG